MLQEWLDRIARREPELRVFAWLDADAVRRAAAQAPAGPLRGRPVGVKDIIDTRGIPTEYGSPLFAGRVPDRSATVVERVIAAGGVLIGKTVTAELAYYTPGPTRNPWDPTRTPGGSSMGSAAGIAAGMFPLALGTQTNGSIIRPAAFCGVVGYKPSFGVVPRDGVMTFSQTLDQVGVFAASVADAALLAGVIANRTLDARPRRPRRLALAQTSEWSECEPAMRERFLADVAALAAAGAEVEAPPLPEGFEAGLGPHRVIMAVEAYRNLGPAVERSPDLVSRRLRDLLEEGSRTPEAEYREALRERERLIAALQDWAAPYDAVLSPPALGEAPPAGTTGDPRLCTRWTLTGAPAITVPTGRGPHGLPLGLQLSGAPATDARVLAAAAWASEVLTG